MKKILVLLALISSVVLNSMVSMSYPKVPSGNAEVDTAMYAGGILGLFIILSIIFILIYIVFKKIIEIFKGTISTKKRKNIFEKIFYSNLFGPFISEKEKDNIVNNPKGRLGVILYIIFYIIFIIGWISLICIILDDGSYDEFGILIILYFIFLIFYKFVFNLYRFMVSIFFYIKG